MLVRIPTTHTTDTSVSTYFCPCLPPFSRPSSVTSVYVAVCARNCGVCRTHVVAGQSLVSYQPSNKRRQKDSHCARGQWTAGTTANAGQAFRNSPPLLSLSRLAVEIEQTLLLCLYLSLRRTLIHRPARISSKPPLLPLNAIRLAHRIHCPSSFRSFSLRSSADVERRKSRSASMNIELRSQGFFTLSGS